MLLSKESLKGLIALQERDKVLDALKADMAGIPEEIAGLRAKIETEKSRAAAAKTKTLDLEKKKKEKELELAQKEESAQKHGRELNAVKTNEAFKALQSEIDKDKAAAGEIETRILEIMEQIDQARREEKAMAGDIAAVEKGLNGEIARAEARLAEVKGTFESALAQRNESAAGGADGEAVKLYEHIRARGKLDAVVAVDGAHCGACRIALAPQVIVNLTRANQVVACENCQRILYRPESLTAQTA
ncbi:MAG TPA: C4-type zinc ribbon domain-containing protein [Elusimicrobiota bacterium]|nr:C4-type zinc ribbon domain-containing protein [Elusimicrobiota bacterium]